MCLLPKSSLLLKKFCRRDLACLCFIQRMSAKVQRGTTGGALPRCPKLLSTYVPCTGDHEWGWMRDTHNDADFSWIMFLSASLLWITCFSPSWDPLPPGLPDSWERHHRSIRILKNSTNDYTSFHGFLKSLFSDNNVLKQQQSFGGNVFYRGCPKEGPTPTSATRPMARLGRKSSQPSSVLQLILWMFTDTCILL